jgi:HPt (histidine-containing phosphotransfer) domain-containing protein
MSNILSDNSFNSSHIEQRMFIEVEAEQDDNFDMSDDEFFSCENTFISDSSQMLKLLRDIKDIDITKPHGLLGAICDDMKSLARRRLDIAYPLYSLQLLALISAGRAGYDGARMSIYTYIIASTSAGKENGQNYVKDRADELGIIQRVTTKPRSGTDIIRCLVAQDGKISFIVDEIHELLNSIASKNSSAYLTEIGGLLLELSTSGRYLLAHKYKEEIGTQYAKKIQAIEKELEKEPKEDQQLKLETKLKFTNNILDKINNGFPNPCVSLAGASTPKNIDQMVNRDSIESGFIGRGLLWRADEYREKQQKNRANKADFDVIKRLKNILDGSRHEIKATDEAINYLSFVNDTFDLDKYLNDSNIGGIYARLYERVINIASIMAVETGVITLDDVKFSVACCMKHLDDCEFLLSKSNANEDGVLLEELYEVCKSLIIKRSTGKANFLSQIEQSAKQNTHIKKNYAINSKLGNKWIFTHALDDLLSAGMIKMAGKKVVLL